MNCAATARPVARSHPRGRHPEVAAHHDDRTGRGVGLLPVALATGVGTDSQRPFALVIVSGLFTRLLISVFLMPALYALVAARMTG